MRSKYLLFLAYLTILVVQIRSEQPPPISYRIYKEAKLLDPRERDKVQMIDIAIQDIKLSKTAHLISDLTSITSAGACWHSMKTNIIHLL